MNARPPMELIIATQVAEVLENLSVSDLDESTAGYSCDSASVNHKPLLESRWEMDYSYNRTDDSVLMLRAPQRQKTAESINTTATTRRPRRSSDVALKVPRRQATNESIDIHSDHHHHQPQRVLRSSRSPNKNSSSSTPFRRVMSDPDHQRSKPLRVPRRMRMSVPTPSHSNSGKSRDQLQQLQQQVSKRHSTTTSAAVLDETKHMRRTAICGEGGGAAGVSLKELLTDAACPNVDKKTCQHKSCRNIVYSCDSTRTQRIDNRRRAHFALEDLPHLEENKREEPEASDSDDNASDDDEVLLNHTKITKSLSDQLFKRLCVNIKLDEALLETNSKQLQQSEEETTQQLPPTGKLTSSSFLCRRLGSLIMKAIEADPDKWQSEIKEGNLSIAVTKQAMQVTNPSDNRPQLPGRSISGDSDSS